MTATRAIVLGAVAHGHVTWGHVPSGGMGFTPATPKLPLHLNTLIILWQAKLDGHIDVHPDGRVTLTPTGTRLAGMETTR